MTDHKKLAEAYVDAVAKKDVATLLELLAPDVRLAGPTTTYESAGALITAVTSLAAIHVRNDIQRVFVDGDEVCVIYDFVTDTSAGTIPTVEWLRIENGRIRSIRLLYDRLPWQTVLAEMTRRTTLASA
jgi:ketosteroid isomerase-like protein